MIRLIIFDYDDTLVSSSEVLYDTDTRTAEALGLRKPSRKEYFSLWGKPHDEMVLLLHPGVSLDEYHKKYQEIYDTVRLPLVKDAKVILEKLKKQGHTLALLSAKKSTFLEEHLSVNNIRDCFEYIHSAESSPYHKPDPLVFGDILKHFRVSPQEALYVGDQLKDYEAATKAGIRFVAVTTGIDTSEEFKREGCQEIISSLSELEGILA